MHFQLFWWRSWVRLPAGNASTFRNLVPEGQTALGGPLGVPFPVGIQPGSGKYIYNYILYIYTGIYFYITIYHRELSPCQLRLPEGYLKDSCTVPPLQLLVPDCPRDFDTLVFDRCWIELARMASIDS